MKLLSFLYLLTTLSSLSACSQSSSQKQKAETKPVQHIGGPCEGCEAVFESPVPFDELSWVDTLPDYHEPGPKMQISGVVYQADGKTPAKDVVLYIYHTGQDGKYTNKFNEKAWGARHGYIRGWIKTNEKGQYKFYTLMPASYPNSTALKHIHPTIKEPGKNEYYIDEFIFDDDPFLTTESRNHPQENRGGDGLIKLKRENGILIGERDIYLGRNIPGYPAASLQSGLAIGSNCPAFDPKHLSGIDMGKRTCPMCKYGYGQGIMVWFNHTNLDEMKTFVQRMESEMKQRGEKKFRVFMVYMNPSYKQNDATGQAVLRNKIIKWCEEQSLKRVSMVWVPSPVDEETCGIYEINAEAKNTIFLYRQRKIVAKWINMAYNEKTISEILKNTEL